MITADIIRTASAAGLTLAVRGDQLSVKPAARLPPDLRALLVAHKIELLAYLRQQANDLSKLSRAWRVRFSDGTGCTAIGPESATAAEMSAACRWQFGARLVSVESQVLVAGA